MSGSSQGVMMGVHWKALGLAILTVLATVSLFALLIWMVLLAPKWVLPSLLVAALVGAAIHLAYMGWKEQLQ